MMSKCPILFILFFYSCNPFLTKHDVYEERATLEKDEPVHLKNSLEWWYFTGHLNGDDGNTYGIEYVFFHFTTHTGRSNYMINFALSNPQADNFYFDYDFYGSRKTPEAGVLPLNFVKGPYSLSGQKGVYALDATMQNHPIQIDLNTTPLRDPVFQNGTGYENYGGLTTAGYFSYPRLETTGEIVVDGETVNVSGKLWYDRQWNCGSDLINGKVSWDWMSIHFEDSMEELMVYRVEDRRKDVEVFGGSFHKEDGEIIELANEDIQLTPLEFWKSPDSKRNYPFKWQIKVPSQGLDLELQASFPHQELILNRMGFKLPYWEGMCEVTGKKSGAEVTGNAYLEMTNRSKHR